MIAPFYKYGMFNSEVSLVIAFVIGLSFGFFLERGGFGSGRLLAAQFYFTDMRVFKVMFTAMVTNMIGIYYLSYFGVIDYSLLYYGNTYILPDIVGGLILGIGFVIGGYCPGTSGVAIATGKIDAIFYAIGGFIGIFIFDEMFPVLGNFMNSTAMGMINIPDWLDINYGFVLFVTVLIAIVGFTAVEWGENFMAKKRKEVKNA